MNFNLYNPFILSTNRKSSFIFADMEQGNRKTLQKEEAAARNFFTKTQKIIWGNQKPHWFIRFNYYLCSFLATCALIWHAVSYYILKYPEALKEHKHVDVIAIVERRGNEIGFTKGLFLETLIDFSFYSSIIWFLLLICLILLWRRKQFYTYILIGLVVIYIGLLFGMLGTTYFIEDTTLFDKISLGILIVITLLQNFLFPKTAPSDLPALIESGNDVE